MNDKELLHYLYENYYASFPKHIWNEDLIKNIVKKLNNKIHKPYNPLCEEL